MSPIGKNHPLRRFFTSIVEHAFCTEVGLCDPGLTGYLSDLLVDFMHINRLATIGRAQDKQLEQIAAMLAVASDDKPKDRLERDRLMYRHIGDYTLFWAGVFPEQLKRSTSVRADVLLTYVSRGKKSYAIASELGTEDGDHPASLFRHLSDDFEHCLYGLGLVRREWEHGEGFSDVLVY